MSIRPTPVPPGFCPTCWAKLPPRERRRTGGRPRMYCDEQCKRIAWLMATLGRELGEIDQRGRLLADPRGPVHLGALAELRRQVWELGNAVNPTRGRKSGTTYWVLGLECGHFVDRKARRRQVDGISELDPAPVWTRCEHCNDTKRTVLHHDLYNASDTAPPWSKDEEAA